MFRQFHHPVQSEGTWGIPELHSDQKQVVFQVVAKIKEWIEWDGKSSIKPLRMTVHGRPGTGKSVIIKALFDICYRIFGHNECVQICAPTGGAAYNAGGQTCHRQWGVT